MNRKKQHNERNMWSFDVDDVGTANIVAGFLMAILSFRHKPLFTIIYFFFYYNTFRWFKSKFRHSCSKSFIMNWHGWVLFGVCVCVFWSSSVCVCVFWSSLVIKTKISNYITPKSELYRFDWMYCGKWERSALKIIEIKKKKKKHTLSYTIILMIWLNWTMVGFWNKFTILFRSQLNTMFFFLEKKDMKFLRKKNPHKRWV